MTTLLIIIVMVVLMIGFNALYVAGEFASVSARKSRITQMANDGSAMAKMLLPVLEDQRRLDSYIAASQVGITISSVVLGIFGQRQIAPLIAPLLADLPLFDSEAAAAGISATLVLILLTTLQVVLGELVPKSLALQYPERIALLTALPMRWSADFILKPLIVLLNGSGNLLMNLLGIHHGEGHKHVHSPEEIKYLLRQSHEGGLLDDQEHRLLDSAFRFGRMHAVEIMIPRTRITGVDVATPVDEVLRIAAKGDHTRIPIYDGTMDRVLGFVHLKELFQLSYKGDAADVRGILRHVTFVHESILLDDLWAKLNEDNSYLAIIFDEYGGTVGMVTREDLLEELFGEVQDEFDASETLPLRKIEPHKYRVRGDVALTFLNDRLGLSLPTDDAYTIGGLILNRLREMPVTGDEIKVGGVHLRAETVKDRTIEEVIMTLPSSDKSSSEEVQ